jgi:hypothetical protein
MKKKMKSHAFHTLQRETGRGWLTSLFMFFLIGCNGYIGVKGRG